MKPPVPTAVCPTIFLKLDYDQIKFPNASDEIEYYLEQYGQKAYIDLDTIFVYRGTQFLGLINTFNIETLTLSYYGCDQELAINYAKKKKIEYEIKEPKKRKITKKSYADNFLN